MRRIRHRWLIPVLAAALWLPSAIVRSQGSSSRNSDDERVARTVAEREPVEIFVAANTAYDQGDYANAIRGYSELVAQGRARAGVHYNLGNAYLRNGQLGRAIASFRRSRSLAPRNSDTLANLDFARKSARDAIDPPAPSAVASTLFFWHYRLSRSEIAIALASFSSIFWALATVRIFRRRSEILTWMMGGLLVMLLLLAGSLVTHVFFGSPVAVIVSPEIDAYTAPDLESTVRFKLHAGTELRVGEIRDGWVRIALPDGQQAWVEESWVELVQG